MKVNELMPIQTIKELPATTSEENKIDISLLEGWEALSEKQKFFVGNYFDLYPQTFKACVISGVSEALFNKWTEDFNFNSFLNKVEKVHAENLASVQYKESYHNPKIRTQQLQAMGQKGYDKKTVVKNQNFTFVTDKFMHSLPT